MAAKQTSSVYNDVVRVTHVYLGPAAHRFIQRQVENHLRKSPESLTKADILDLIDWIKITVALLTDDSDIIEEYIAELRKLAET